MNYTVGEKKNMAKYVKDITLYCTEKDKIEPSDYTDIVVNYILYYHKRARAYKHFYYGLNICKFAVLLLLPISQAIDVTAGIPVIPAGASAICIFIEALLELTKTKDKWIQYRNTNNALMCEQRRYATRTGKYKKEKEAFGRYVECVEPLIDDEARRWCKMVRKKSKGNT